MMTEEEVDDDSLVNLTLAQMDLSFLYLMEDMLDRLCTLFHACSCCSSSKGSVGLFAVGKMSRRP